MSANQPYFNTKNKNNSKNANKTNKNTNVSQQTSSTEINSITNELSNVSISNDQQNIEPDINMNIEEQKYNECVNAPTSNKNNRNKLGFNSDDHIITCVEEVGHGNILKVTTCLAILEYEWNESELGPHDELQMYLGCVGKIIEIEEDDDTVQLQWGNMNHCWIPIRACAITWKDSLTIPVQACEEDEDTDAYLTGGIFNDANVNGSHSVFDNNFNGNQSNNYNNGNDNNYNCNNGNNVSTFDWKW